MSREAWILAALLLAVPFSLQVDLERGARSLFGVHVPLVDPLLWLVAAGAVVAALRRRGAAGLLARRDLPPAEILAFAGVVLASSATARGAAATEVVQHLDGFVFAYVLVAWLARGPGFRRGIHGALAAGLLVPVALAAYQQARGFPYYLVRGPFLDRASYSAACLLFGPLVWARLRADAPAWRAARADVGAAFVMWTLTSGPAFVLFALELVLLARLTGDGWVRRCAGVAGLALLLGAVPAWSPFLREGAPFWVFHSQRRADVLDAKALFVPPRPLVHAGLGPFHVFLGANVFAWAVNEGEVHARGPEELRVVEETLVESWAALHVLVEAPLLGFGPGSWQRAVDGSSSLVERTGTSFPGTSNGYLLIGVQYGLLGLAVWMLAVARSFQRAVRATRAATDPASRATMAGAAAGQLGGALFLLFSPWPVQPVAVFWIVLAALPRVLAQQGRQ